MTFSQDAAARRPRPGRLLVRDHVQQGHLHDRRPTRRRVNLGTVNLDAGDLAFADGKLTLFLNHDEPAGPKARASWLPAPVDQFCLVTRAYVPGQSILDNTYQFPDIIRT